MDESTDKNKSNCSICSKWIRTPAFLLLCNFLLSQWGDWMWQFSAGLYLVHLSEGQLRLAAVFGLTGGTCVLLFGGIIGDWVDKNGRLKVVRVSLFIQNISVASSAACVCLVLAFESTCLSHEHLSRHFMEAAIVILAVIAQLASVAYKIAIEKDWIIIIASGKSNVLSNLNALTRSLDLLCKILSPLTAGFIMSKFSMFVSACVIAIWNVVSVFIEYSLLARIYHMVPQLAKKGTPEATGTEMTLLKDGTPSGEAGDEKIDEKKTPNEADVVTTPSDNKASTNKSCLHKIFDPFIILIIGWRMYARQSVVFAGISLACLYMTVLGFDSITLGYIYANNISEFLVGISMGMAGVTGIIGTFLFAIMAKRFGLERTGIFAFLAELSWLTLALASVWTPGSKFDPGAVFPMFGGSASSNFTRTSTAVHPTEGHGGNSLSPVSMTTGEVVTCSPPLSLNISMILLLVGIIMSRIGLWMADLVVTQMMQESIAEQERGIVNGVQNSLNMSLDMLKFILVIFLPQIEIFGLHIILSFAFISAGAAFFCYHVARAGRRREGGRTENNNNVSEVV